MNEAANRVGLPSSSRSVAKKQTSSNVAVSSIDAGNGAALIRDSRNPMSVRRTILPRPSPHLADSFEESPGGGPRRVQFHRTEPFGHATATNDLCSLPSGEYPRTAGLPDQSSPANGEWWLQSIDRATPN